MWMCTPPSSTMRRASAAYSSGVYGIAGHWSRLASAPEMAQVMMTGWSRAMAPGVGSRQCDFPLSHAWPSLRASVVLDLLAVGAEDVPLGAEGVHALAGGSA